MEFSAELRERVLAGDITVSFRLWRRPKVKAGGRYRVGHGQIEVDSVDLMTFAAITTADVRRAGEVGKETSSFPDIARVTSQDSRIVESTPKPSKRCQLKKLPKASDDQNIFEEIRLGPMWPMMQLRRA